MLVADEQLIVAIIRVRVERRRSSVVVFRRVVDRAIAAEEVCNDGSKHLGDPELEVGAGFASSKRNGPNCLTEVVC